MCVSCKVGHWLDSLETTAIQSRGIALWNYILSSTLKSSSSCFQAHNPITAAPIIPLIFLVFLTTSICLHFDVPEYQLLCNNQDYSLVCSVLAKRTLIFYQPPPYKQIIWSTPRYPSIMLKRRHLKSMHFHSFTWIQIINLVKFAKKNRQKSG